MNNFFKTTREHIKDYLTFPARHRKGTYLLLLMVLGLCVVYIAIDFIPPAKPVDVAAFQKEINEFEASLKIKQDELVNTGTLASNGEPILNRAEKEEQPVELFSFNPNNLADEDWKRLGLSGWQTKVIKNFETKGGKFYKKEDLKKIYSITPELFAKWEPYISIPEVDKKASSYKKADLFNLKETPVEENEIVELNIATEEELKKIKGIKDFTASAIIKLRNKLQGFSNVEQLREVYGMDSSRFELIKNNVTVNVKNIRTLNINTNTTEDLRHPYITYNLAKLIVNYHKMHGDFSSVEDLKKLALVDDELYRKLAPYLAVK